MICPLPMSLEAAACVVAARVMGYPTLSEVMSLAVIVLAASTARWRAQMDRCELAAAPGYLQWHAEDLLDKALRKKALVP